MNTKQFIRIVLLVVCFTQPVLVWAQAGPNQTLSITNSTPSRISFSLIINGRSSQESLEGNVTRQYTTTQAYQISLPTAGKPPSVFVVSPPNKYTIQWNANQKRWVLVASGRFY